MSADGLQGASDGDGVLGGVGRVSVLTPAPLNGIEKTVVLAKCWQCCQRSKDIAVQITIRGVPESVRDELASRAALQRQSMQEFLRSELEPIASRPSVDEWVREIRERKAGYRTNVPTSPILAARDADRT